MTPGDKSLVKNLPQRRSETYTEFYASTATLGATFYDVSLILGHPTVDADGNPFVEQSATIIMSWEHAKAVAQALKHVVEMYERDHKTVVRQQPGSVAIHDNTPAPEANKTHLSQP